MKTIINITTILSMILMPVLGFSQNNSKQMDAFTVKVDGLGCPFCAYGLEKKFKELKGMKAPNIDMETGIFTFEFPSADSLSIVQVEQQVEKAGYTPIQVEIIRADGKLERSEASKNTAKGDKSVTSISFKVEGNCGMCKARIEKAAKSVEGVLSADWNENTKLLQIKLDKADVSRSNIEKAIAMVGHNTENHTATGETYENLPPCCRYRK